MFKTTLAIVMATLCLFFRGQAQDNKAIDLTAKGIQIGQQVPDITIKNLHNYKDKNGKPATSAKISDFKGKLLILDFWATWCAPCIAMFPAMQTLEEKFKDQIYVLKVAYEPETIVNPFLSKFSGGKYSKQLYITNDISLKKLFPHIYLPHLIWIDPTGVVRAFTGGDSFTEQNIARLLLDRNLKLPLKLDVKLPYDWHYPFFEQNRQKERLNNGLFQPYSPGYASGFYVGDYSPKVDYLQRITLYNTGILWLYQMAWGKNKVNYNKSRLELRVADTTRFYTNASGIELQNWMKNGNAFSYELVFPKGSEDSAFVKMQQTLNSALKQYKATIELQNKLCWVLVPTDSTNKSKTEGGKVVKEFSFTGAKIRNTPFKHFFDQLNWVYLQNIDLPVLDETGLTASVDLDIDALLYDMEKLNAALQKYGLTFKKAQRIVSILVITDRQPSTNLSPKSL